MPQMGVSVTEGTLAAWHKRVGDRVEPDERICEISTDKIDTDIPAPAGGRVSELLVAEGETVAVGTVLARIESETVSAPELLIDAGETVAVVMHAVPSEAPAAAGIDAGE
ncbi:MAG: biotin/lipoyl-containing protein, partial [Solirubrobacteraceae bacterium]